MGGSFESGAGDDPNDLFTSDEEGDEEINDDQSTETPDADSDSATSTEPEDHESTGKGTRSDRVKTGDTTETGSKDISDLSSAADVDAAQLAREFVPETYEKPHAWALGRDGVNDGRAEKKTFFLQSSVLDLEAACSQEVNEILEGDVPLTDLRELALILAYQQPELLAEAAREWGAESA